MSLPPRRVRLVETLRTIRPLLALKDRAFIKALVSLRHIKPSQLKRLSLAAKLCIATVVSTVSFGALMQLLKVVRSLLGRFQNRKQSKLGTLYDAGGTRCRTITVPYKNRRIKVELSSINYDRYEHDRLIFKRFLKEPRRAKSIGIVESRFLSKLYIIWKLVLIPKLLHKNTTLLLAQLSFLVARTWLTLLVTKLDGQILKDLVGFNVRHFMRDMLYWFLFAVPASYVNSGIKFLTRRLSLSFRTNLTRYCHDIYMNPRLVYYKLQFNNNNDQEYQLNHLTIDQNMTEDIKKFSDTLAHLFTSLGKPAMDLVFFAIYLRDNIGSAGIVAILLNYLITGIMMKRRSPNFNKLWKQRTHMEGIYYNYNQNLVSNCEEIAFYKGTKFERDRVSQIFKELTTQIVFEVQQRFHYQILEDYILKYVWTAAGYAFAGLPILFQSPSSGLYRDDTSNMKSFVVNKRLILSMADAGSRLMYSVKEVSKLSGVTDVVFNLLVNLHQTNDQKFQYGLTDSQGFGFASSHKINSFVSKVQLTTPAPNGICGTIQSPYTGIRMENVSVVIPSSKGINGKHLLKNLSFNISRGQNLLVLGKNGVGKTAIVRLISELWPLYAGLLSKPSSSDIYYVSQRPYFTSGSFRDQIIYPLNQIQMLQKGYTDEILITYLKEVGLGYLLERFGSLDYNPANESGDRGVLIEEVVVNGNIVQVYDNNCGGSSDGKKKWPSLLSGGERQKLVFARILFHNKPYVVMDEPTSAVSYDFEDLLFELMRKKGFTMITITGRDSLMKYHDFLLDIVDKDHIKFTKIDEAYLKHFENATTEIEYLETELKKMEKLEERRQELSMLLDGYEDDRSEIAVH